MGSSASRSRSGARIDGVLTAALVVCVGTAFVVFGNLDGRIVGLLILSPWIYLGARQWVRHRSRSERARLDSNQGPTNYEFAALTAELRARDCERTR
jgi:hypothetical protein